MKKIFCLTFMLFASLTTFAQEKNIEKAEFDKVFKHAFQFLPDQGHREIRTMETVFEPILPPNVPSLPPGVSLIHKTYMKTITEFLPQGFHSIVEFNTDSINSRTERITIAGKNYLRKDGGKWTEEIFEPRLKSAPRTKKIDVKIEYKFLGEDFSDSNKKTVYAKIETGKLISLTADRESFSKMTMKYWFDENGKLLKTSSVNEIRGEKSSFKNKTGTIYEDDSNIVIELPNLN